MISTVRLRIYKNQPGWSIYLCSVLSAKSLTKCFLSILTPLLFEWFIIPEEHFEIENESFYSSFKIKQTLFLFLFSPLLLGRKRKKCEPGLLYCQMPRFKLKIIHSQWHEHHDLLPLSLNQATNAPKRSEKDHRADKIGIFL